MAILTIILVSNCTRVPENNDPVIGIWANEEVNTLHGTEKLVIRKEWIFNDAYLGRYHRYEGSSLIFKTDFHWEQTDGTYTITYPGTDLEKDIVIMNKSQEQVTLEDQKGNILAVRE